MEELLKLIRENVLRISATNLCDGKEEISIWFEPKVSGISVSQVSGKVSTMTAIKAKNVIVFKGAPALKMRTLKTAEPIPAPGMFGLIDGPPGGTFQVTLLDSETPPQPVTATGLATLAVTSNDPNVTVSVSGMQAVATAASGKSGTASLTFTVTMNDGSGVFTFVAAVPYSGGAISGISVVQTS